MRYHLVHNTTYTYDRPVVLAPHTIRLRPRCDVTQSLRSHTLKIHPKPTQIVENVDLDGNTTVKAWFSDDLTDTLTVNVASDVETYRENPFAFLLESTAVHLPMDYSHSLYSQLQPYIEGPSTNFPVKDAVSAQLAQEIWHQVNGNTIAFLTELNQRINANCKHLIRETGDPYPPAITWNEKAGSCRDMTILFMEVCRAMGLATRFVSGYQEGDPDWEERHLHAWAEVYLPGGGWRGYDPTQGLAVGDRHIALVASPSSRHTAPISGTLKTFSPSQLDYHVEIVKV